MKKFVLLILSVLFTAFTMAQNVNVQKESAHVNGERLEGFEVTLEGTIAEVTASLNSYLKTMGKTRLKGDVITIQEPSINGTKYTLPVFALSKGKQSNTSAWIGIRASNWPEEDVKKVNKELEKTLYEFGVKFNRDKIQVQIDESSRATLAVEKQQQKLVNQNKDLNVKLEDNRREKIQLEESLEKNKLEYETLLQKIEKNKHDQDSVALAGQQIMKVTEMHKERQRKVN